MTDTESFTTITLCLELLLARTEKLDAEFEGCVKVALETEGDAEGIDPVMGSGFELEISTGTPLPLSNSGITPGIGTEG